MSRKCHHGQYAYYCKECPGPGICVHNKRKYYCKECNGSQLCEHNKQKHRCKECKGHGICEHNKEKYDCVECKGNGICEHGRRRRTCVECDGNSICEHKKYVRYCVECNGNAMCQHGREKYKCKECEGCEGSQICKHKLRKYRCKECDGRELCKSPWCEIAANKYYDDYCFFCYCHLFPENENVRAFKSKELEVVNYIKGNFAEKDWVHDKKITDGCSKKRPDLLLDLGHKILIIEIDENQHERYDCSCENKRLVDILQDVGYRPVIFIRFNPDAYIDRKDNKIKSCWGRKGIILKEKKKDWENRLEILKYAVEFWMEPNNNFDCLLGIIHLYYDGF